MKKYSEEIHRYSAVNDEGRYCEILERVTFERPTLPDGSVGEPAVINRRFDLQTGEPLHRLNDTEFEDQATGVKITLQD